MKIKAFASGFNYAVKYFEIIQDHHHHTYPGASWHDKNSNDAYRKGISFARKYMQYRYEILALYITFIGIAVITIF